MTTEADKAISDKNVQWAMKQSRLMWQQRLCLRRSAWTGAPVLKPWSHMITMTVWHDRNKFLGVTHLNFSKRIFTKKPRYAVSFGQQYWSHTHPWNMRPDMVHQQCYIRKRLLVCYQQRTSQVIKDFYLLMINSGLLCWAQFWQIHWPIHAYDNWLVNRKCIKQSGQHCVHLAK